MIRGYGFWFVYPSFLIPIVTAARETPSPDVVHENLIWQLATPAKLPVQLFGLHRIRAQSTPDTVDHVNQGCGVFATGFEAHESHVHQPAVFTGKLARSLEEG